MPPGALALALAAAVLHPAWNLLLARAPDSQAATAVAFLAGTLACLPVGLLAWDVDPAALPFALASIALQLAYLALLGRAYDRAELSLVYPVARGSAPVLVLAVTVLVLGAGVTLVQALGVLAIAAGVLAVRGLTGTGLRAGRADLLLGLAIGACIAGYTTVDAQGIDHAEPIAYLLLVVGVPSLGYAAAIGVARGARALRAAVTPATVAAGLASFAAYGLALAALAQASAASVAAVRESSVLIAVALAAALAGERVGPARMLGAVAITGGIAALALA